MNSAAPVLVMTTEILRNLLFTERPQDIATAVLDECHFLGDEGRGTVWEEIIINAPPGMQLVGLSATVSNVHEIAEWISEVHRPIRPIIHTVRPVPLTYLLCHPDGAFAALDAPRRAVPAGPRLHYHSRMPRGRDHEALRRGFFKRRPANRTGVIPALKSAAGCRRSISSSAAWAASAPCAGFSTTGTASYRPSGAPRWTRRSRTHSAITRA